MRSRDARIKAAADRQQENAALSPQAKVGKFYEDRIRKAQEERDEWKAKYECLLLRIHGMEYHGMEYHANLNNWDASELWKALPPNDRADRGRTTTSKDRLKRAQ